MKTVRADGSVYVNCGPQGGVIRLRLRLKRGEIEKLNSLPEVPVALDLNGVRHRCFLMIVLDGSGRRQRHRLGIYARMDLRGCGCGTDRWTDPSSHHLAGAAVPKSVLASNFQV
jgi:hypothetical protein